MKNRKIVSLLLAAAMLLPSVSALAENIKHERVYVVTGPDGTVMSITDSVRLENADNLDEITDRTLLTGIENLSGNETFTLEGETLLWQAKGKDVTYQGTSDKTPAILPVVSLTLDGEKVSAAELKEKTGDAVLTVAYQSTESLPALAVTLLLLPEEGVTDLKIENATVLSAMGRQLLVGWAVPGVDEELNLPTSFTASFHADHAELNWAMTLTTSDPIDEAFRELDSRIELDYHKELDEAAALLTAMKNGEELPETTGKTKDIVPKINELNDGLTHLNDGAKELADGLKDLSTGAVSLSDGASQVKEGAASLSEGADQLSVGLATAAEGAASLDAGLVTLTANNEGLNNGAALLFAAVLDTANTQLAASGLDAAGITIPVLTAENYEEVLDAVLSQLDPEALQAAAYAQVEEAVRPQVEANKETIRAAVEQAIREKVQAAVELTFREKVPEEQMNTKEIQAQISAAVDTQMQSEEILSQIEAATTEQMEVLVKENTEAYLASNEELEGKLAQAQAAKESLTALKEQLDQVNAFVTGLKAYTDGVSQAADGAAQLNTGISQANDGAAELAEGASSLAEGTTTLAEGAETLANGAATLSDGANTLQTTGTQIMMDTILDAERTVAETLLPYLEGDITKAIRIYEKTRDEAGNSGYDLRPEGMKTVTVYIIRTDLQ